MPWMLMVAGAALALLALGLARRPPRERRAAGGRPGDGGRAAADRAGAQGAPPNGDDPKAAAWAVLQQPLPVPEDPWRALALRPALRQFRLGALFGLGVGLVVAGVVVAVAAPPRGPGVATPGQTPGPGAAPAPAPPPDAAAPGSGAPAAPGRPAPAPAPSPPAVSGPTAVTVTVDPGDTPQAVAAKLQAAGAVADPAAFVGRLVERGLDTRLRTGTFRIPAGASLDTVIDILTAA